MEEEKEEWDGPWKEALDSLASAFELFWPEVLDEVELDRGSIPLEQELQKLTPDGNTGLLRVDKLFEIVARDTGDPRIVHVEAQTWKDEALPRRMFGYGYRGRDHFNQPIGSFAILGDNDPAWKPNTYREGVLGCEHTMTFRVAKVIEWRTRMEGLEAGDNLFGLFLCAHLETMATRGDVAGRQEAKFRLLANLMRRDILDADLNHWYRLIDWIMKLPEDANRVVWLRVQELKESKTVSHVTIAEIIGREKGIKDGIKDGIKESLREALEAKFPQEGPALAAEFKDEKDVVRLKSLHRAAVLAQSPDDFRSRVSSL